MTRTIISRETIKRGDLVRMLEAMAHATGVHPRTPDQIEASLQATLAAAPSDDVWVFGYGSLIWNPAIDFVDRRGGRIWGYHREYCLWTPLGRGTPDNPGLMLGLERGGSCRGIVYRLPPGRVEEELSIVWAREMLTDSYRPVWLRVRTGGDPVWAVTFAVNRDNARYTGPLEEAVVVRHIAGAAGHLGSCTEYLENTVAHLAGMGIRDLRLERLHALVAAHCAAAAG